MKVKIFTEANNETGFGHIIRCSALYTEIKKNNIDVEFVIHGTNEVKKILPHRNITIVDWLDKENLLDILKDTDRAIVDSYLASKKHYNLIANHTDKALFIDDFRRISYPQGIIWNPLIVDESEKYDLKENQLVFSGPRFVLLRDEIKKSIVLKDQKEIQKSILIVMGGTDIRNLTPLLIDTIQKHFPEYRIDVINGNNRLISFENKGNVILYNRVDASTMRSLILKNEFIVSAAGQTIFELLYFNKTFLPIMIADNQELNAIELEKVYNNILMIDARNHRIDTREIVSKMMIFLSSKYKNEFKSKFQGMIDGHGVERAVDELLK